MRLFASILAISLSQLAGAAVAQSTKLEPSEMQFEPYHTAERKILLTAESGSSVVIFMKIRDGEILEPYPARPGGSPPALMTVLSGELSWGDGKEVDPAHEKTYGPGSLIVVPSGQHWGAARNGDVLLQAVVAQNGVLADDVIAQMKGD